jgi:hypothetical protein
MRPMRIGDRLARAASHTMGVLRRAHRRPLPWWKRRTGEPAARTPWLQLSRRERHYTWGRLAQRNQAEVTRPASTQPTVREMAMTCTPACVPPTPSQAHCGTCHYTFSGVSLFDAHRIGGTCHHPRQVPTSGKADAGYVPVRLDHRGVWRYDVPRTNHPTGNTDTQTD